MAINENKPDPDNAIDDSSSEEPVDASTEETPAGLAVEDIADRPYDEREVWDSNKNFLYIALGIIGLVVAAYYFFQQSEQKDSSKRSEAFVKASMETEGAEARFLGFAKEYDGTLGGVASFRAAVLQYQAKRYADAAESFQAAVSSLGEDPLRGRAMLGQGVSLLKQGSSEAEGLTILRELSSDADLLPVDRAEARFLLAVHALSKGDADGFSEELSELSGDLNASYFHSRLEELAKARKLLGLAKSLPELNLSEGNAFLGTNRVRPGVKTLESGLQYEVLKAGTGSSPLSDDEVEVHYHGTLLSGEVFDSSVERGEPSKFGVGGVIKGWTEALQLMSVGDKWKLFIPSDLAYGESGSNSIGPNETLTFEVELLSITPRPKPVSPESNATLVLDPNSTALPSPVIDLNGSAVKPDANKSLGDFPLKVDLNGSR